MRFRLFMDMDIVIINGVNPIVSGVLNGVITIVRLLRSRHDYLTRAVLMVLRALSPTF